jgi:hypothetical protein
MLRQSAFLNWRTTGATGAGQVPVRQCASAPVPLGDCALERRGTPVLYGLRQLNLSDWRKHLTGPPPAGRRHDGGVNERDL